ncbi:Uncharacterized protein BN1224_K7_A_03720 [Chlamydia pneumoniae]|nr:Uncharacterized protein BN1224_K7_A_03720 [Chlamydia pneumoniae]
MRGSHSLIRSARVEVGRGALLVVAFRLVAAFSIDGTPIGDVDIAT